MPAPPRRRSFFRATGRALTVWLLLVSFVAAQEEDNLGLANLAEEPQQSPAFVSFASGGYKVDGLEEYSNNFLTPTFRSNSFELMKQHVLHSSSGVNILASGWRMEAFVDDWRIGFGDEVVAIESEHLRYFLKNVRASFYGAAGVRLNDIQTNFNFTIPSPFGNRTAISQTYDHTPVGPQLAIGAVVESSIWRFEAVALGMIGYQRVRYELQKPLGQEVIPGVLNRVIPGSSSELTSVWYDSEPSWQTETRLTASCQLTHHWRFDAIWRGFIANPVYTVFEEVVYSAPNFTTYGPRGDKAYGSDLFLGLTYLR